MCPRSRKWWRCIIHFSFFLGFNSSDQVIKLSVMFRFFWFGMISIKYVHSSKQFIKVAAEVCHVTPARRKCILWLDLFTERPFQAIAEIWSPLTEFPAQRSLIRINGRTKAYRQMSALIIGLSWLAKKNMKLKDFQEPQLSNEKHVCGHVRGVSPGASVESPSLRAWPDAAQEAKRLTPNVS